MYKRFLLLVTAVVFLVAGFVLGVRQESVVASPPPTTSSQHRHGQATAELKVQSVGQGGEDNGNGVCDPKEDEDCVLFTSEARECAHNQYFKKSFSGQGWVLYSSVCELPIVPTTKPSPTALVVTQVPTVLVMQVPTATLPAPAAKADQCNQPDCICLILTQQVRIADAQETMVAIEKTKIAISADSGATAGIKNVNTTSNSVPTPSPFPSSGLDPWLGILGVGLLAAAVYPNRATLKKFFKEPFTNK